MRSNAQGRWRPSLVHSFPTDSDPAASMSNHRRSARHRSLDRSAKGHPTGFDACCFRLGSRTSTGAMGTAASSPVPAAAASSIQDTIDNDGRLPLLQRLQHAISRGDLAGLIAAVEAADAAAAAHTTKDAPPRLVLSRHLLFSAVRAGHAPVVGWLLDRHEAQQRQSLLQSGEQGLGPAATLVDNRGDTLLHAACRHGHLGVVALLLERGFQCQIPPHLWRNHRGRDPVLEAVVGQQKHAPFTNDRLIKRLLLHPAFPHALDLQDTDGRTALWYTAYNGNLKLTRLLLRAGADPTLASFPPTPPDPGVGMAAPTAGAGADDATAGTTPLEVLRRRRRARGFIRLVEDAAAWRAARIARARLLAETRDALRLLLAAPTLDMAGVVAPAPAAVTRDAVLKAVPAFLRPRVLAVEGGEGGQELVAAALAALPSVEMGGVGAGETDDEELGDMDEEGLAKRRLVAAVAHVVDGGGLKPELLLELLALMGGGRAARP